MMFRHGLSFHVVLLISYLANGVLAQTYTSATECGTLASLAHKGAHDDIRSVGTGDPMSWCPYWAVQCAYVYQHCPGVINCSFINYDSKCLATYDPSPSGNSLYFLRCSRRCDVQGVDCFPRSLVTNVVHSYLVNPVTVFPPAARVPRIAAATTPDTPSFDPPDPISPDSTPARPDATAAERRSIYATTFTFTALLVVGGFLSSAFAKATRPTVTGINQQPGSGVSPGAIDPPAPLSKTIGRALSVISPFTLLLHFQSISSSGFLSISYAPLYQYFTLNFSWANLIIPLKSFQNAARKLDSAKSCVRRVQSNMATDQETMGLGFLAEQYTGDRGTIGTLAFLSAIAVVVIVLLLSVLVGLVLHILSKLTKSSRIQAFAKAWPSIASNFILRLVCFES